MDNLIISLPQFTETPIYTDYYYRALRNDDIDTVDQYTIELIETIDTNEYQEAIQTQYFMTLRDQYHRYNETFDEYNYSEYMEYDSMNDIEESTMINWERESNIDTDLPF